MYRFRYNALGVLSVKRQLTIIQCHSAENVILRGKRSAEGLPAVGRISKNSFNSSYSIDFENDLPSMETPRLPLGFEAVGTNCRRLKMTFYRIGSHSVLSNIWDFCVTRYAHTSPVPLHPYTRSPNINPKQVQQSYLLLNNRTDIMAQHGRVRIFRRLEQIHLWPYCQDHT